MENRIEGVIPVVARVFQVSPAELRPGACEPVHGSLAPLIRGRVIGRIQILQRPAKVLLGLAGAVCVE